MEFISQPLFNLLCYQASGSSFESALHMLEMQICMSFNLLFQKFSVCHVCKAHMMVTVTSLPRKLSSVMLLACIDSKFSGIKIKVHKFRSSTTTLFKKDVFLDLWFALTLSKLKDYYMPKCSISVPLPCGFKNTSRKRVAEVINWHFQCQDLFFCPVQMRAAEGERHIGQNW